MTTINGKACVANGRNLLLDTNFNNLPQYWTARAGTVSGTFNGNNVIYYDAKTITFSFAEVLQQPIYDPALTNNRVLPSQWYTLSFYAKGVGKMTTYVSGGFVDTASCYVDGVKSGHATNDGSNVWDLTDDWTRHTYTIKSKSSLPATGVKNVLWRLFKGNEAYICMPKLETGTLATPLTPAPVDKVFSDGRQVYGRNLLKESRGPFTPNANPSNFDNILYTNAIVSLEEGATYTISASSNGNFTSDHNGSTESDNIVLWLTNAALDNTDPKFDRIISSQTTGTTGTTFTWSQPSNTGAIRVNAYHKNPIMHVEKIKIEKGSVATPWTPAPENVM
jgi:hypothetical protein